MKRYDMENVSRGWDPVYEMVEGELGDYVRFEEAQAEIAKWDDAASKLQGHLSNARTRIESLRDELTAANLERDALKGRLRTARNIIVDTQNFIHPTQVWRDTDLMQRVIDKFLEEGQS